MSKTDAYIDTINRLAAIQILLDAEAEAEQTAENYAVQLINNADMTAYIEQHID